MTGVRMWGIMIHNKDHLLFNPDGLFGNTLALAPTRPGPQGIQYSKRFTFQVQYKEVTLLDTDEYRCTETLQPVNVVVMS